MTYRTFRNQCKPGTKVKNHDRTGYIIKINQDKEKALVRFEGGMVEWIEFYKIELA